ncbi:MAG: hypothetical protein C0505_01935 [Leptothrix sp. (in: Bacteria)]|nr:hypothetical protein [Leptothrix sp. (in: b-proteobacteria)]
MLKQWDVYLRQQGRPQYIGEVSERHEALARCAALSRYGVSDEEIAAGEGGSPDRVIYPDDEFSVSLVT